MNASCRSKIAFSLISVLVAVALPVRAEEPPNKGKAAVGAPRQAPGRPGPAVGHPGPAMGHPGPAVGRGGPPGAHFVRGNLPAREFRWTPLSRPPRLGRRSRWHHEVHNGRDGWWWDVGGVWYFYPQQMDGPPAYVSEDFADDIDGPPVADGYAPPARPPGGAYPPPPVAYEPPPPPPPPDPGASAVGGAIVGGVLGGLLTGRASGAAAGAIVRGRDRRDRGRHGNRAARLWMAQGNCCHRYPSGQYVQADPRACYRSGTYRTPKRRRRHD